MTLILGSVYTCRSLCHRIYIFIVMLFCNYWYFTGYASLTLFLHSFRTWLWITTQAASARTELLPLTCFLRRLWRSTAVTMVKHCLVTVCQALLGWHLISCILPHHICNRLTWVFINFSFILFSSFYTTEGKYFCVGLFDPRD